jgi:hypothetical protein
MVASHPQKKSSLLDIDVRLQLDISLHFQCTLLNCETQLAVLTFPAVIIVFSLSHCFV